ncbi:MAG: class I SAM-dependent methyltransferase [Candidatus Dormibacteria bacterium]
MDARELRAAIDAVPVWYHTMELAPGVVTPGWFDLRPIVDRMPWPDLHGKRCLDVGTYDGFLAFEMERRGAAEVVCLDIPDHRDWDWPPLVRTGAADRLALLTGEAKGTGFDVAYGALKSTVRKVPMSAYDISEPALGRFDFVVCGSLLLHLRDPLRALEAMRSVCDGEFLSAEHVDLALSVLTRNAPVARINGADELLHWWIPTVAGHRQMVRAAGFDLLRWTRPYGIPFGPAHPAPGSTPRDRATRLLQRAYMGNYGLPHAAVLARPAV